MYSHPFTHHSPPTHTFGPLPKNTGGNQDITHAAVRKETKLFHWFRLENKKGLLIYFTYEDTHVHNNKNIFL